MLFSCMRASSHITNPEKHCENTLTFPRWAACLRLPHLPPLSPWEFNPLELLQGSSRSLSLPMGWWWRAGDTQVSVGNVVKDVLVVLCPRFMESQVLHKPHSGLVWDQNQQLLLSCIVFNPDNIVALLVLNSSLRPLEIKLNVYSNNSTKICELISPAEQSSWRTNPAGFSGGISGANLLGV